MNHKEIIFHCLSKTNKTHSFFIHLHLDLLVLLDVVLYL